MRQISSAINKIIATMSLANKRLTNIPKKYRLILAKSGLINCMSRKPLLVIKKSAIFSDQYLFNARFGFFANEAFTAPWMKISGMK